MTKKLSRTLRFLRITDGERDLSLTNLALLAALVNVTCTDVALQDLLVFLGTIVGYHIKRFAGAPTATTPEDTAALQEAVKALETKVTALQIGRMLNK